MTDYSELLKRLGERLEVHYVVTNGLLQRDIMDAANAIRALQDQIKEIEPLSKMTSSLLTLLDRIEVENDYTLASQRFEIARQCDMTVEFHPDGSAEKH